MSLTLSMSIGVLLIIITLIYGYRKILKEAKTDIHTIYIITTKSFSTRQECPKVFLTEDKALKEFNRLIANFYATGFTVKDLHIKGISGENELCYKSVKHPSGGEIDITLFKVEL